MKLADAVKCGWVNAKIVGTPSVLNTKVTIDVVDITVNGPFVWLALPVGLEKRACSSFDYCLVSVYECLFTWIRLQLSFSNFEVVVLKHLKIAPSQLHLGSWTYLKVFEFYVEHKSWKPSLRLFFKLLYMVYTSHNDTCDQRLISLHQHDPWFNHFTCGWVDFLRRLLLVKPLTPESHLAFCYPLTESSHFYKRIFLKYWFWLHFHHDVHFYRTKFGLLSFDEVMMKENICS